MLEIHPLTPDRWDDLAELFGASGAYSGCWCMWWRVTSSEFAQQAGEGLKQQFATLVARDRQPGLLAYLGGSPVGWMSLGDRGEFGRLNRSPKLRAIDDQSVRSIVCFYVARPHRRTGVGSALLEEAIARARQDGTTILEAYPIDASEDQPSAGLFTGTLESFLAAGFTEVARRGGRPIVRLNL